jgi:hypothetical protein
VDFFACQNGNLWHDTGRAPARVVSIHPMSAPAYALTPRLRGVPDARRGRLPLVEPVAVGYLAFALGLPVAGLAAVYCAVLLRRPGLALMTGLIAASGWLAFWPALDLLADDVSDLPWVFMVLRVGLAGFGVALAVLLHPHVRGHRFIRGRMWPVLHVVVGGMVLGIALPWWVKARLLGYWWAGL